jgi:hypothetical protein
MRVKSYLFADRNERSVLTVLHDFLTSKREEIIARTKSKVAARSVLRVAETELAPYGVRLFLDQLIETLKDEERTGDGTSASKHGKYMLRMGFTVAQVVYDYGNVCQAVTELASEMNAAIALDEFHTLNRCLHDAIAQAVTEYGRLRERSLTEQGTKRMRALAHDMRNRLTTAFLSLESIKAGEVAIGGSTGSLLGHSLNGLNDLIDRALAETHQASTIETRETIEVAHHNGRA